MKKCCMMTPPILRLYYSRRPIQWCNGRLYRVVASSSIGVDKVDVLQLQKLQWIPYPLRASNYSTSQYFPMTFRHGKTNSLAVYYSCHDLKSWQKLVGIELTSLTTGFNNTYTHHQILLQLDLSGDS